MFENADAWRAVARARYRELLLGPGGAATPIAAVQHHLEFDGLSPIFKDAIDDYIKRASSS